MKSESVPLLLAMLIAIAFLAMPVSAFALVCGDSEPDIGEQCDDGNTTPGDGCSASCTVEAGSDCTMAIGSNPPEPPIPSMCLVGLCGDGIVSSGEVCDDANLTNGDGCTTVCTVETGYNCSGGASALAVLMGGSVQPSFCAHIPDAPLSVAGRPKPGKINVLWSPVTGAGGYKIWRGEGSIGVTLSLVGISATTLFVDKNVLPDTTYTYAIQTVVTGAESEPSDHYEVFIPAAR